MKKTAALFLAFAMIFLLTACGGEAAPAPNPGGNNTTTTTTTTTPPTENNQPDPTPNPSPVVCEDCDKEICECEPGEMTIEAHDGNLFNEKDKAVPLGEWAFYWDKNFTSGEYEPFYVRIIRVSRDSAEIQAAMDAYSGIMDFTLTDEQAKDIEFGLLEYEVYYAPDYTTPSHGISLPRVSWSALPTETSGFRNADGVAFIGVGSVYGLNITPSNTRFKPGDTVTEKGLFTILKNYDESEYVFRISWYDGEIVAEKARQLYFTAS